MADKLRQLADALPAWLNATTQHGVIIAEVCVNLRLLPSGEVELTVGPAGPPMPSDRLLQATGSVDEFVQLARQLDAVFAPT